jgi:hypothetical protein
MYSSNVNAPNFVKQALLGTKGQKGPDTKIVGDFINRQIIQTKKLTNFRVKLDLRYPLIYENGRMRKREGGIKEKDRGGESKIYCKHLCKYHNVPPV